MKKENGQHRNKRTVKEVALRLPSSDLTKAFGQDVSAARSPVPTGNYASLLSEFLALTAP